MSRRNQGSEDTSTPTIEKPPQEGSSRQLKFRRPAVDAADKVLLDTCQLFLDSLEPVALLIKQGTREVVACNKTAKELGITLGSTCYQSWANRETPCPWCRAPKVWKSGKIERCQVEGEGRIWNAHWVPISDDLYLHYAWDNTDHKRADEELNIHAHDLGKRVKELRGLLDLSQLTAKSELSPGLVYQQAVELLPPAWHYPEITCGRIVVNQKEYNTNNYVDTAWKLSAEILVSGVAVGMIEVAYLKEMPQLYEGPFLSEERDLIDAVAQILGQYIERHQNESRLRESHTRLIEGQLALETKNDALSEVIEHVDREKKDTGFQIQSNIDRLVVPLVAKLEANANEAQKPFFSILRSTLNEITSPFVTKLERDWTSLTPREVEICNLIRNGLSSKDIAQSLHTSEATVRTQRKTIRRKLGLSKSKTNLANYLQQV